MLLRCLIAMFLGMLCQHVLAVTPTGLEIAEAMRDRPEGRALAKRLTMQMTDKRGKTRLRHTQIYRKNTAQVKKTAIYFLSPRNLKGTGFLTYDYVENEDDQWLYLPAARKVRRLSSSERGDFFLGTDFTYDDVKNESKFGFSDYQYENLGVIEREGKRYYRLQLTPVSDSVARELGYSRIESLINSDNWYPEESVYFDIAGNRLKTVQLDDIRLIDTVWTAHRIEAFNHKTQHTTVFEYSDVVYLADLEEQALSQQALVRGIRHDTLAKPAQ